MSLLLDAANSIRDMNAPMNKGNISVTPDTRTGGSGVQDPYLSGYEGADASNSTTGKSDVQINTATAIRAPFNPSVQSSTGYTTRAYVNMGTTAANTGSLLLKAAGKYLGSTMLSGAGQSLGKVAGGVGLALSAYDIARGEGNTQSYANIGLAVAPKALTAAGSYLGSAALSGAGQVAGAASSAIGTYAAPAILARQGLSAVLSNQSNPYAKIQGELMQEPTFEGLTGAAVKKVASGLGIGGNHLENIDDLNRSLDPVGSLMKGQFGRNELKNIFAGGTRNAANALGINEDTQRRISSPLTGGASSLLDVGQSTQSTVSAVANVLTGGISGLFGTVVCTELYYQGHLTEDEWIADGKFGKQVLTPKEYEWYISWGKPLAAKMKQSKTVNWIVRLFMKPVSIHMAGEMGVGNGSFFGKIILRLLRLICMIRG